MPLPGPPEFNRFSERQREKPQVRRAIAIDQVTEQPLPQTPPLSLWDKLNLARHLWATYQQAKQNMKTKASWKTTVGGIIAGLGAIAPFLPPTWLPYITAIMAAGGAITGLSARDNGVTSEQAGAK